MGKVKIGKVEYEADSFSVVGNNLRINDIEIHVCDDDEVLQLRGKDTNIDKLITNSETIIEGVVGKSYSKGNICAVNKVLSAYSHSRNRFYNSTAKEEYTKAKKFFTSRPVCQTRVIINCNGDFSRIYTNGRVEVNIKGDVKDVFSSKDLLMKGLVKSAVCDGTMYISK